MSYLDKIQYGGTTYDLGKPVDDTLSQSGHPADAKIVGRVRDNLNVVNANSHGSFVMALELGVIDTSAGTNLNSTTRVRCTLPFNSSIILNTTSGYKIKNIYRYNYNNQGELEYAGYNTINSGRVVFMAGRYMNGSSGSGIEADAYRIVFSKQDDSAAISQSEIDEIIDSIVTVNTNKIIELTGAGATGAAAGATNIGDIYYNTSSKLLRVNVDGGSTFFTCPYPDDAIYKYDNHLYIWTGTDFLRTDADNYADIRELQDSLSETETAISSVIALTSRFVTLAFEQGGLSLYGQPDNGTTAIATRIRTGYINTYRKFSFSVTNSYQARVALYDKGGNFISLSDYGTSFLNVDNINNLVRILVKHSDNSNITVSEMSELTYSFHVSENIYSDVVPTKYFEPMFGNPALYKSTALEHTEIDSKTSSELFAEYDQLVSSYPRFFKRDNDIGEDAYGNTIRAYTLGFTSSAVYNGESGAVNIWDESYNYKTILITSGVHGGEKSASWGLMLAIKDILQSSEAWAMYIKGNLILKIIPCVNVWGFDNNSRLNYKDVNVNRDAYTWESEEGQALKSWYDANLNAIYYMDVHGTNGGRGYQEIWGLSPYKMIHCRNCAKIGASLYSDWVTKFGRYPTFPGIISSFNGLLISYLEAHNIPAAIVETPRDIKNSTTDNYLDSCAFVMDVIINLLQAVGNVAFKGFPFMS